MRRMYSKQQLEEIAKYLVEHTELNFLEDIAFAGDVSVGGDLSVTGDASVGGDLPVVGTITGGEIIENMSGYSFAYGTPTGYTIENVYVGVVKNGNKVTFVTAFNITKTSADADSYITIGGYSIPSAIGDKLFTTLVGAHNFLDVKAIDIFSSRTSKVNTSITMNKASNVLVNVALGTTTLVVDTKYYARYEATFLLSDSL